MLLHQVERYLQRTRTPPARFGRDAIGDPCFVFDLRDGREPRAGTVARVLSYIEDREQQLFGGYEARAMGDDVPLLTLRPEVRDRCHRIAPTDRRSAIAAPPPGATRTC